MSSAETSSTERSEQLFLFAKDELARLFFAFLRYRRLLVVVAFLRSRICRIRKVEVPSRSGDRMHAFAPWISSSAEVSSTERSEGLFLFAKDELARLFLFFSGIGDYL